MNDIKKDFKKGIIITVIASIIFGVYPPASQLAMQNGANATFLIIATTFMRTISLIFFSIIKKLPLLPRRTQVSEYLSSGLLQALSIIGIFFSLMYIPSPVTIIILFTHTFMLLIFLSLIGEEKLSPLAIISTLSALFGLTFVVNLWDTNAELLNFNGLLFATLAAFATASRLYVFGKQVKETNPSLVGARVFTVTFLVTLFLCFYETPILPNSNSGYIWFFISGLCLTIGTFLMFYGIYHLGSFRFSFLVKLEPIFTATFSFLLLQETLRPMQYMGMIIVLASLIIYQIRRV